MYNNWEVGRSFNSLTFVSTNESTAPVCISAAQSHAANVDLPTCNCASLESVRAPWCLDVQTSAVCDQLCTRKANADERGFHKKI